VNVFFHDKKSVVNNSTITALFLCAGATLLKELKKLDDKALLVEVQLLESKTYHALKNLPRARSVYVFAVVPVDFIDVRPFSGFSRCDILPGPTTSGW
jgi:hypothetical protein